MKYYLGVDYFFFFEDFPHMGVPGVIVANSDGTANIYINTLYCEARQQQTIRHELRHLAKNHFYCDWMSIDEKELDADDPTDGSCLFGTNYASVEYVGQPAPRVLCLPLPNLFAAHGPQELPCFKSLDAFHGYLLAYAAQERGGQVASR